MAVLKFYILSLHLSFSITIAEPQSVPIKNFCCHLKNFMLVKNAVFAIFNSSNCIDTMCLLLNFYALFAYSEILPFKNFSVH